MKKGFIGLLIMMMVIVSMGIHQVQAKETMLKMATFLPKDDVNLTAWWVFVEEVNK